MSGWPEDGIWDQFHNGNIILATQGARLWSAPGTFEVDDNTILVKNIDTITLRNLRKHRRVAFTVGDSYGGLAIQGNGIVRGAAQSAMEDSVVRVEPYRLVLSEGLAKGPVRSFERRLQGWIPVALGDEPNIKSWDFWYAAFRAVTLSLSALPVLIGAAVALARGFFDFPLMLLCLSGAVLAHAGANAISDYYDLKKGVDLPSALSSHLGALAGEHVDPELIRSAAIVCFSLVAAIGIVLVMVVGWPVLIFGVSGILGGIFYTGGPVSYKYRAMGELWLGVLMGPLTGVGTYFVIARGWDWVVFLLTTALGMLVSSVSLVNNLRDMPNDRAAKITTLPMMLGINTTKTVYYLLTVGSYFAAFIAVALDTRMWPVLIVLASLPQAMHAVRVLRATANDESDIRIKARISSYPVNSIILHKRFATLAVVGILIVWILSVLSPGLALLQQST